MVPTRRDDILTSLLLLFLFGGISVLSWHYYLYPTLKLRAGVGTKAEITAVVEGKDSDGDTKYSWHYRFKIPTLEKWESYSGSVSFHGRPDDGEKEIDVVYLPATPSVNAARVDVFGRRFFFFVLMTLIMALVAAMGLVRLLKILFGRD